MRLGPLGFLFAVVGAWTAARTLMLWPDAPVSPAPRRIAWAGPITKAIALPLPRSMPLVASVVRTGFAERIHGSRDRSKRTEEEEETRRNAPHATPTRDAAVDLGGSQLPVPLSRTSSPVRTSRWSLSSWMLVRGSGSPGLAAGGQLAGSQTGLRLRYRLTPGVHLAARMSGPLQISRGKEAAIAVDLQPLPTVPVVLSVERRVGLDAGGRDAFAVSAFGGFDARLTPRVSLDGYAQAGVVGLRRRDLYVDGSLRMEREIVSSSKLRLGAGLGAWGGAQPGVARLDVGPQLVAHVPAVGGGIRIGAEWRQRVAGDARPGSGPVLSFGADF